MTFSNEAIIQKLNRICAFAALKPDEIETFLHYVDQVHYMKNEVIAEIGEIHEAIYILVEGKTGLYIDKGESVEVGTAEPGELVGEMSFFDRNPRQVRLCALLDNTCLLRLSRSRYDRLRVEHPYITVNILECAIMSLDHLFRQLSTDVAIYSNYLYSPGKK